MTRVSSFGGIPYLGGAGGGVSSTITLGKTLGGSGLMAGDHTGNYARSIQLNGPLRGRNLDGLQADPDIYTIPLDVVLASAPISSTGGVQEVVILPEVERCDILEVGLHTFVRPTATGMVSMTPADVAGLQGGFYTAPPRADGTPAPDSVILPWETTYSDWAGGYTLLAKVPVRQMFVPDIIFWIPKQQPSASFTFEAQFRATVYWEQQSTIVEARG